MKCTHGEVEVFGEMSQVKGKREKRGSGDPVPGKW
jgi:hypothetical protein